MAEQKLNLKLRKVIDPEVSIIDGDYSGGVARITLLIKGIRFKRIWYLNGQGSVVWDDVDGHFGQVDLQDKNKEQDLEEIFQAFLLKNKYDIKMFNGNAPLPTLPVKTKYSNWIGCSRWTNANRSMAVHIAPSNKEAVCGKHYRGGTLLRTNLDFGEVTCKKCLSTYKKILSLMNFEHPDWNDFVNRMSGPEGCNFKETIPGVVESITWTCNHDHALSMSLLKKYWSHVDIEKSIEFFKKHGGYCDCEIVFNIK